MALYNERKVREYFKKNDSKILEVSINDIVTPQAKEYLNDIKVKLLRRKKSEVNISNGPNYQEPVKGKSENITHLYGNTLVSKDNEIIVFRGKIDSFQADILLVQNRMHELNDNENTKILGNILDFTRAIMQAEVKSVQFEGWKHLMFDSNEIRARSHNPNKYYGVKHILPNYKMGEKILLLNKLRSSVREVELLAVKALNNKIDIIEALNRLSSFIYICMIQIYAQKGEK
jgi:ethanolamine utilization cobalamin adenosyltransferase